MAKGRLPVGGPSLEALEGRLLLSSGGEALATSWAQTINLDADHPARFVDSAGHMVSLSLSGVGSGSAYLTEANELGDIVLSGTTSRSVLSIIVSGGGRIDLRDIEADGAMGGILAPTGHLEGRLTAGGLESLTLAGIENGEVEIGSLGSPSGLTMNLGDLTYADIRSAKAIRQLNVNQWLSGTPGLLAPWVGQITCAGEFTADVTLSSADSQGNSLSAMSVGGWLQNANIRTAGNIGKVVVGGMDGSLMYAGVCWTLWPLPQAGDFIAQRSIDSLAVTGARGFSGEMFVNSRVAAWDLGTIALKNVATNNVMKEFGLSAGASIAQYVRVENSGTTRCTNLLASLPQEGDFVVSVAEPAGLPRLPAQPTAIDKDGDGYGVNAPLGPDADDNDPAVNTYPSVLAKYGTIDAFIAHLGYAPKRIFTTNVDNTQLQPGDMVLLPAGTYTGAYPYSLMDVHGTAEDPIIIMATPGELVRFAATSEGMTIWFSSHIIIDGLVFDGTLGGGYGYGIDMEVSDSDITFRNINEYSYTLGLKAMQGMTNITVEDSAFHDNTTSHGIYFGSRDMPNSDIFIRRNLLFDNCNNGFQHNGRVTNLVLEDNIIHSNRNSGISLLEGVCDSVFSGNLIYNNRNYAIVIKDYDDAPTSGILPYDQVNNQFTDNVIWVGRFGPDGSSAPTYQPAVQLMDQTAEEETVNMNVSFSHNIVVSYTGVIFQFTRAAQAAGSTITGNALYRRSGSGAVLQVEEPTFDWDGMAAYNPNFAGNNFVKPDFQSVSVWYWSQPGMFDFTLLSDPFSAPAAQPLTAVNSASVTSSQFIQNGGRHGSRNRQKVSVRWGPGAPSGLDARGAVLAGESR